MISIPSKKIHKNEKNEKKNMNKRRIKKNPFHEEKKEVLIDT